MTGRFDPRELLGPDGVDGMADLSDAQAAARALETLAATDVHPSAGFVDRVMAAVADEPVPSPALALGFAVRRRRIGQVFGALHDTWRVAWTGGRPMAVRAQALAFVLVAFLAVGSVGGVAAIGAAGALGLFEQHPTPTLEPAVTATPEPTPSPSETETTGPSESAEPSPSESAEPSSVESAEPSDSPTAAPRTPMPTDSTGPRETPHPTETSGSGETPAPTESSSGSGSGGGGSDG